MNLIGDRWIPVVFSEVQAKDGKQLYVGLRELFERSAEIRDLAVTPPQRVAVMRLLLCITQAALDGPADENDWRACRDRIVPASLSYLASRHDKFELYGERPFLQVADLETTDNASVDKLDFGLAAGNNATLFDQEATPEGRVQSDAWIALQLLTFQCFSPGGTIGNTNWNGKPTGSNSNHAPCIEASPLLSIIRCDTLLTTIHFNLVTRQMIGQDALGIPIWDRFPDSQTGVAVDEIVQSHLGRLTPLSRAILLNQDRRRMTLANGLSYLKMPESRDSMATVIVRGQGDKERHAYLNINLEKQPWRELTAVLTTRHRGQIGSAYALEHLLEVEQGCFDLWVGGFVADKGKPIDAAEWIFSIPAQMLQELPLVCYENGVQMANRGGESLRSAVKEYCAGEKAGLKLEPSIYTAKAIPAYWSLLDIRSEELIRLATDAESSDLEPWRKCCHQAMTEAYAQACPHATARQIKAFVAGRKKLYLKNSSNDYTDNHIEEGDEA
jgi:CRISPR system Cascade subunit CasA